MSRQQVGYAQVKLVRMKSIKFQKILGKWRKNREKMLSKMEEIKIKAKIKINNNINNNNQIHEIYNYILSKLNSYYYYIRI